LPATFSRRIIQEVLRKKLSFQNVILSDDLEMGAIVKRFSFEEAVVRTVDAGHDLILICHQPDLIRRGYQALKSAYQERNLDPENLEKSDFRLRAALKKLQMKKAVLSENEGWDLACAIARSSVELVQRGNFQSSNHVRKKEGVILVPHFFEFSDRYYFESVLLDDESIFLRSFERHGWSVKESRFSLKRDFNAEDFLQISPDSPVILFCFDATNFPAQKEILLAIQKRFKCCAVVLLRNPYDNQYVQMGTTCIQTYGFRSPQIQRAIEVLCEMKGV
jgi:beta-N-acetylhexosaminidase